MFSTKDFRTGLKIEMDGIPFEIVEFLHVKPGKGGAFIRTKLRNILNSAVIDRTFRSGEKFVKPDLETRVMQYLYRDSEDYVFMDMSSYEQVHLSENQLGDKGKYLLDGQEVDTLTFRGQVIDISLPITVVMAVTQTEPGIKGDTVSGATKPARVQSGLSVNVPLFVNEGDRIKIDTRNGSYLGRE